MQTIRLKWQTKFAITCGKKTLVQFPDCFTFFMPFLHENKQTQMNQTAAMQACTTKDCSGQPCTVLTFTNGMARHNSTLGSLLRGECKTQHLELSFY